MCDYCVTAGMLISAQAVDRADTGVSTGSEQEPGAALLAGWCFMLLCVAMGLQDEYFWNTEQATFKF